MCSSRKTRETGEIVTAHTLIHLKKKKRSEDSETVPWKLQAEGIGKTREGADGGVTLRESRGRREERDTVALPICFFSGHQLLDIGKK